MTFREPGWRWALLIVMVMCAVRGAWAADVGGVPSATAGTKGNVIAIASAKSEGRWTNAAFDALPEGGYRPNACEAALAENLRAAGFGEALAPVTDAQRAKARELRTVFRRYADVSSIPNDFAVRIGAIIDPRAAVLVACGVAASAEKKGVGEPLFNACAQAHCKAIGMSDRRRIATASGTRCLLHADRAAGEVEAIRQACLEMGAQLGGKIASR